MIFALFHVQSQNISIDPDEYRINTGSRQARYSPVRLPGSILGLPGATLSVRKKCTLQLLYRYRFTGERSLLVPQLPKTVGYLTNILGALSILTLQFNLVAVLG